MVGIKNTHLEKEFDKFNKIAITCKKFEKELEHTYADLKENWKIQDLQRELLILHSCFEPSLGDIDEHTNSVWIDQVNPNLDQPISHIVKMV